MKDRKKMLTRLTCAAVLMVALTGCFDSRPTVKFGELTPPIIVVAMSEAGSVVVCDSANTIVTIPSGYAVSEAIGNSYEIGDTLYYIKY